MERKDLRRALKLMHYEKAVHQFIDATHIKPLSLEEVALGKSVGQILAVDIAFIMPS